MNAEKLNITIQNIGGDEALNINHYDKLLYQHMKTRLLTLCDDYRSSPELFTLHDEATLKARYDHLQLRDASELRLSNLCVNEPADAHIAGGSQ